MRIADYFDDKTIFITGATGFLGQPLVEKILYAAPGVKRMYVLIRETSRFGGKKVTAEERLESELFGSSVFDRLRVVHGDGFRDFLSDKVRVVAGDIARSNLGLDAEVASRLRDEVDIVINSAAVVSFDAPVDQALNLNVRAAGRTTEFARSCKKVVLVHVSTAYVSGATHKNAPETIYHSAPPGSSEVFPRGKFTDVHEDILHLEKLIEEVKQEAAAPAQDLQFKRTLLKETRKGRGKKRIPHSQTAKLKKLRGRWIQDRLVERGMAWARQRGWNDTYTYTKAMGEQLVLENRGSMPTIILRPSVIESSLSEPSPGWLDGLRMADPLIVAIGKGRLKSLPLDPNVPLDLVPVDVVVNALLAAVPRIVERGGLEVYQVATGSRNPITLGELYRLILDYFQKHPMLNKKGKPIVIRSLKFPNPATFRLQHHIKRVPLDTAEKTLARLQIFESTQKVRRRISAARAAHQRLYYYGEIYEPYLNLDCVFSVDKTMELFQSLDLADQKQFNFDVTRVNWRHYIQNVHIPGVKKYILKLEGVGTMELDQDNGKIPFSTIPELVRHSARQFGDKTALQMERGDRWVRVSFKELETQMDEIGAHLQAYGLTKGDRVVLFSENQPEWGVAYLAASVLGLIVVPIDSQTWHREVWSICEFTGAKALLASEKCLARLPESTLERNESIERPTILLNVNRSCMPFEIESCPRSTKPATEGGGEYSPAELVAEDPASIIFTTGTAVDPKGALHSHRNFLKNLYGVSSYLPINQDDALLSVLPLYHALEFSCGFLMAVFGGMTVTYTSTLKPRLILKTMRETGTTCLLAVPTFFALLREDIERRVLKSGKSILKSGVTSTSKQLSKSIERRLGKNIGKQLFGRVHQEFGEKLRILVSGGSALGKDLYDSFKTFGLPIYEGYGLTETAPVLTVNPINRSRAESAGKPLPGVELRLDYPDSRGVGEIVVRSPSLMMGYYGNPEATAKAMQDGWFRTGDLGWVDVDGYLYITGRIKNVIVTGAGKNVYVEDLEVIYGDLESVQEIAVIGVRKGLTEEVHAVIRPNLGLDVKGFEEAKAAVVADVRRLSTELPSYHRLQQIHFWPEGIPKTDSGEIDRHELRRRVELSLDSQRERRTQESGRASGDRHDVLLAELSRLSGVSPEKITRESNLFSDLGLDSLQAIELLLFAEHRFNLSIPDERAAQLHTMGDLLSELEAGQVAGESAPSEPKVLGEIPVEQRSFVDRALQRISMIALKILYKGYFRVRVTNSNLVPRGTPYIIAANHSSHLDSGAVLSAVNLACGFNEVSRLRVLGARDYFFESPVRGWLVSRLLNVVPIERKEAALGSLRIVKSILDAGDPVVIFPEGTRSRSGVLQEFKAGLGLMAWESGASVVPVFIEGTGRALPVGRLLPRPRKIEVRFGEPVPMDYYSGVSGELRRDLLYREIANDVRERIQQLGAG